MTTRSRQDFARSQSDDNLSQTEKAQDNAFVNLGFSASNEQLDQIGLDVVSGNNTYVPIDAHHYSDKDFQDHRQIAYSANNGRKENRKAKGADAHRSPKQSKVFMPPIPPSKMEPPASGEKPELNFYTSLSAQQAPLSIIEATHTALPSTRLSYTNGLAGINENDSIPPTLSRHSDYPTVGSVGDNLHMRRVRTTSTEGSGFRKVSFAGEAPALSNFKDESHGPGLNFSIGGEVLPWKSKDWKDNVPDNSMPLIHPNPSTCLVEVDQLTYDEQHRLWYWQQIARFIRLEENYDSRSNDFTESHVPVLCVEALKMLQKHLESCYLSLDEHNSTDMVDVLESALSDMIRREYCSPEEKIYLSDALLMHHKRVGEKYGKGDIKMLHSIQSNTRLHEMDHNPSSNNDLEGPNPRDRANAEYRYVKKLADEEHAAGVSERKVSIFSRGISLLSRQRDGSSDSGTPWAPYLPNHSYHSHLKDRLPSDTEAVTVQVATLHTLWRPVCALIRLPHTIRAEGMMETNSIPIRCLFLLFVPPNYPINPVEVGRCMASLCIDKYLRKLIFNARHREDLVTALDLFVRKSVLVPLTKYITRDTLGGMYDQIRFYKRHVHERQRQQGRLSITTLEGYADADLESIRQVTSVNDLRAVHSVPGSMTAANEIVPVHHLEALPAVVMEEKKPPKKCHFRPFSHLLNDIRMTKGRYLSDFKDAFVPLENFTTLLMGMLFLYFCILAPSITFGQLLNTQVNNRMSVPLILVANGAMQAIFTMFNGQPLGIVGHTGPVFIIESSIASFATTLGCDSMSLRLWACIYTACFGLLIQFFNGVRLIRLLRGTAMDLFNAFIGFFFFLKALFTMLRPIPSFPPLERNASTANCTDVTSQVLTAAGNWICVGEWKDFARYVCGIVIALIMLEICLFLVTFKNARVLRRRIRVMMASLNVPIGILLCTILCHTLFRMYELKTLTVPSPVQVSGWTASPNFTEAFSAKLLSRGDFHGLALVSAICLTLITFTETGMTGLIVSKPEKKLVKPSGYSQDIFIVHVVFSLLCGFLGWPFASGAPVRANVHCLALSKLDFTTPPGIPKRLLGTIEQRVSGTFVGIIVVLSVFLGPLLRLIPIHAMYGMFLYMGIIALRDLLMKHQLVALFKRTRHWQDRAYLKDLKRPQLMFFVFFAWLTCFTMVTLNVISEFSKQLTWAGLLFPVVVIIYNFIRELILPKFAWFIPYLDLMDKKTVMIKPPPKKKKPDPLDLSMTAAVTVDNNTASVAVTQGKESELKHRTNHSASANEMHVHGHVNPAMTSSRDSKSSSPYSSDQEDTLEVPYRRNL